MADLVLGGIHEQPSVTLRRSVLLASLEALALVDEDSELLVPLSLWLLPETAERVSKYRCLILLKGSDDPLQLQGRLENIAGVAVEFVDFNDGRGYSIATLLRERLGYQGQLRAVGDVLRDQLFLMLRCGFDAFEPRSDRDTDDFILGYRDFRVSYQRSATSTPLFSRRIEALADLQRPL